jgi:hypothetical protein
VRKPLVGPVNNFTLRKLKDKLLVGINDFKNFSRGINKVDLHVEI